MATTVNLKASGLQLSPNQLSAPEGGLSEAENVIIRRQDVVESRRGIALYGNSFGSPSDRAKQILEYKSRILRHYQSSLQFDDGSGTFSSFSGSYSEANSGLRIKSVEVNGNLYFTTSEGIKKIAASSSADFNTGSGYIVGAGGVKALDVKAILNTNPTSGPWFTSDSLAAYKVVWGIKDVNDNLVTGTPSNQFTIFNSLKDLIIKDYMSILGAADDIGSVTGCFVNDKNYVELLKLQINASSSEIRTSLISFAQKLDNDIVLANDSGTGTPTPLDMDESGQLQIEDGVAKIVFTAAPTSYFEIGDVVEISGITVGSTAKTFPNNTTGVENATDRIKITAHGFVNGDAVIFSGTTIPTGLAPSTTYYIVNATADDFQVATTPDGSPLAIADDASGNTVTATVSAVGEVNGVQTITEVGALYVAFETEARGTPVINAGTSKIVSYKYRSITPPEEAPELDTNQYLESLKAYLLEILNELQLENSYLIPTGAKTAYLDDLTTTDACTTFVTVTVPSGVTTNHFYQVYRSPLVVATGTDVLGDLSPNTEFRLVYEANPTSDEISDRQLTFEDITPDAFAGANLYTNPISGEGITQANDLPPFALDIHSFNGYTFFANTKTRYRSFINLLGTIKLVDLSPSNTPQITIATATDFNTYSFVIAKKEITDIVCTSGTGLAGKYFIINSANNQDKYYVWFKESGSGVDPVVSGRIGILVNVETADTSSQVAAKLSNVFNRFPEKFTATYSSATVTVQNADFGYCDNAEDVDTGFTISVTQEGKGEKVTREITEIDVTAAPSAGQYFTLNTAFDKDPYYVWMKVDGVGSDPAIANKSGILVNLLSADTISERATKIASALSAFGTKFTVEANSPIVTVENYSFGPATQATTGTSPFSVTVSQEGALEVVIFDSADLPSVAQSIDKTVESLLRVINMNSTENVNAFNYSQIDSSPGKFLLESRTLDGQFYVMADTDEVGSSFNPDLGPEFSISSIATGASSVITTSVNHNYEVGDQVMICGSNSYPSVDGLHTITAKTSNTFTISQSVITAGTIGGVSKSVETSANEVKPNRIYYSKYQQPESVPILNYVDVGPKDKAILRIFALRSSLFVFKEEGLYRISGETAPFVTQLFDGTAKLIAQDSLDDLNNLIFGWFEGGIKVVSETGVSDISRAIDTEVLKLSSSNYTNFRTATFGVGYTSENAYMIWTVENTSDAQAQFCYRYCSLTNTWTKFTIPATCGIVASFDDKMYIGPTDINRLGKERKDFSRTDYSDREYSANIDVNKYVASSSEISFNSVSDFSEGDSFTQEQYVTVYKFNSLLRKLDNDSLIAFSSFYDDYKLSSGDDSNSKLGDLLTKLNTETGNATYLTVLSMPGADFEEIRDKYNAMIAALNADPSVFYQNYETITTPTLLETIITDVNSFNKKITLANNLEFLVGAATAYQSIQNKITYLPNLFGDAVSLKQVREATVMLERNSYTNSTLSFATDLLPGFEEVDFSGDGSGIFGLSNNFGQNYFGGVSNSVPIRTYIPSSKQRCRFMVVRFEHQTAREQYRLLGISLTGRSGLSTRAYR